MTPPLVVVVGSYGTGLTFHMSRAPGPGETVVGRSFRVDHGGKGSNQAIAAARLGADVTLCTALGDDDAAGRARRLWADESVAARVVTVPTAATMAGAILVEDDGENRIVIAPGALDAFTPDDLAIVADVIASADVLLVQLEIPLATATRALELGRSAGAVTVLDPAPAPDPSTPLETITALLRHADVITPNRHEGQALAAAGLAGIRSPARNAREDLGGWDDLVLADALSRQYDVAVAMTVGADGVVVAQGGRRHHLPAVPAPIVVDTTGAGDAFSAALAVALAEGRQLVEAAAFGVAVASQVVRSPGVVPALPLRHTVTATYPPTTGGES